MLVEILSNRLYALYLFFISLIPVAVLWYAMQDEQLEDAVVRLVEAHPFLKILMYYLSPILAFVLIIKIILSLGL